jgi:aminoglycoside phosphotransferase family enzyme
VAHDEQRDIIAFLSTPAAFGPRTGAVDRIDTHISIVWLAGDRAYKLKRAVRFDYVDFSTSELRRVACEAEVRLNRRTASALYRGVLPITREADGSLALGGHGEPIDWLVEMARFDQNTLFDRLAERNQLDPSLMEGLADAIVRLHVNAERRPDRGGEVYV